MQFKNLWVVVLAAVVLAPGCASTGSPTTRKIDDLNSKAMADFKAGKPEKAQERLNSALSLAAKEKVTDHRSVAETHMNLGVVAAAGRGQRRKAVDEMTKALVINPDLAPDKKWRDAKVDKAFASAQKRAEAQRQESVKAAKQKPAVAVAVAEAPPAPAKVEEKPAPPPPAPVVAEKKEKKATKRVEVAKVEETKAEAALPVPAVDVLVEAQVPSPVPEPVFCPLPDSVPPGKDLPVWCAIDPDVHAKKAMLFIRPPDQAEFVPFPMERSPEGWWVATVPAASVKGNLVQFYVQGQKQGGDVLAASGNGESPGFFLVRAGSRPVKTVMTQSFLDGEDGPAELPVEAPPPPSPSFFQIDKLWFAVQGGSAYGWHGAGDLEFRTDKSVPAGMNSASTFQVVPEVGLRLSQNWSTSLQLRFQKLPLEGTTGGRPGGPAPGAISGLLRALYERPLVAKLKLAASAYLGGGEGVRFVVARDDANGITGTDTVRGGPLLVGAGLGVFYGLTERFAVSAELRSLVGLPDSAVLGEFNLGLRYALQ